jgi:hypothetical protein
MLEITISNDPSTIGPEATREMKILVSDPGPDGESEHSVYCETCLEKALALSPLSAGEYVIDADDDIQCPHCAPILDQDIGR